MPFYVYNNLLKIINNIIEKENGKKGGESDGLNNVNDMAKDTMNNAMSSSKNMFKSASLGSKMPKK